MENPLLDLSDDLLTQLYARHPSAGQSLYVATAVLIDVVLKIRERELRRGDGGLDDLALEELALLLRQASRTLTTVNHALTAEVR